MKRTLLVLAVVALFVLPCFAEEYRNSTVSGDYVIQSVGSNAGNSLYIVNTKEKRVWTYDTYGTNFGK